MVLIQEADVDDPSLIAFVAAHLSDIAPTSPAESQHALADATARGIRRVSLETGSVEFFHGGKATV